MSIVREFYSVFLRVVPHDMAHQFAYFIPTHNKDKQETMRKQCKCTEKHWRQNHKDSNNNHNGIFSNEWGHCKERWVRHGRDQGRRHWEAKRTDPHGRGLGRRSVPHRRPWQILTSFSNKTIKISQSLMNKLFLEYRKKNIDKRMFRMIWLMGCLRCGTHLHARASNLSDIPSAYDGFQNQKNILLF